MGWYLCMRFGGNGPAQGMILLSSLPHYSWHTCQAWRLFFKLDRQKEQAWAIFSGPRVLPGPKFRGVCLAHLWNMDCLWSLVHLQCITVCNAYQFQIADCLHLKCYHHMANKKKDKKLGSHSKEGTFGIGVTKIALLASWDIQDS